MVGMAGRGVAGFQRDIFWDISICALVHWMCTGCALAVSPVAAGFHYLKVHKCTFFSENDQ